MTKSEHRVRVDSGKYTFVVPADDYRVSILRYGEPWHGPQSEASNALHAIMCELDAARVVVQAFRDLVVPGNDRLSTREGFNRITDALALHDSLTSDREPPSAWCGVEQPDADRATSVVGHVSDARLAEIAQCAKVNYRDHVLTTIINSRDLQLLVAELQRRREHEAANVERADTLPAQGECDRETYRAFKDIDTAATIADLDALMMSLAGKLGSADRANAERRYEQRKAWLQMQASASQEAKLP